MCANPSGGSGRARLSTKPGVPYAVHLMPYEDHDLN